ncbi:hypothetical protein AAFF_G00347800 [Aldrovandia affinis]|uniref:Ketoreductase domain-containing protein n=1 Tax=Aldrovandia affinis TaxID=143900 RepID=A0AAD7SKX0_9TELE|nr:hypothetical protein AAFF_G00347800 [Aldrovandia affinis]
MTGKTAIITGGNTGIGKATALDLARRGARVILACRSKARAEAAVNDIRKESGNNEVVYMLLDLASLKSVRSFAENFLKTEPRLDLLINNAGLVGDGRTEDGFGIEFGVNHLGHFLLTCLLLEHLKAGNGGRVVTVSSMAHCWGRIDFKRLDTHKDLGTGQYSWQYFQAYCNSKLCNILFTRELAKRLQGTSVTCYCLHPGIVRTELSRNVSLWQRVFIEPLARLLFLDVEAGAQTTLHCALQEGIEPFSGRYFSSCAVQEVSAKARDDAVARKLWEGKTALVTGANTGIGKATALDLARRGARVILACRSKVRAEAAVFDIRRESGNNEVMYMLLDLASLKSVRSFAENFLKTEPRLDLLINNAGMMGPGRTEEGFDMAFGVNHLGHFLLTRLLLERLKEAEQSRVVNVAGLLYRAGAVDFASLRAQSGPAPGRSSWGHVRSYCNSKLCNVLFTRELANQLEGTSVTCYCLHPGVIDTEFCRGMALWQRLFLLPVAKLFFLDVEAGAQTTLHCALQEGIEPFSGRYFSSCAVQEVSAKARDDAVARKLWEVSETLSGLS